MNRELFKRLFMLCFTTIALIMSGIVLLILTLGWMSSKTSVNTSGLSIQCIDGDFEVTGYTAYKYNENGILESGSDVTMLKYDTIFTNRNDKCAVVIKIDFDYIKEGTAIKLIFKCNDESPSSDYLSDIVSCRCAFLNLSGSEQEIYTAAKSELEKSIDPYSEYTFRKIEDGTETKIVEFETAPVYMLENGSLYILVNYYAPLIGHVEVPFGGNTSDSIQYPGDLHSINITLAE